MEAARPIPVAPLTTGSDPNPDRTVARHVLDLEAQALRDLAAALDDRFVQAVDAIVGIEGRVVVTGIGKSGHIGRKIAATLASTGTPSLFVHASEASHGDLGMIGRGDLVLALSNSGASAELADIVAYTRRFRIPLIGLTGKAPSPLSDQSDIVLLLPKAPEACPLGLAPTTSTTMALALGDALAIALLERRGFSSDDYRNLHPGGALGRRLLKVGDVMHGDDAMPLADAGTPISEAILIMTAKSFGCVGIVDDRGRLAGIVTDGDLRRHMAADLLVMTAEAVMTRGPRTIGPHALAAEALGTMNGTDRQKPVTSLFVIDADGRPIGIVHIHDCLRAGVA